MKVHGARRHAAVIIELGRSSGTCPANKLYANTTIMKFEMAMFSSQNGRETSDTWSHAKAPASERPHTHTHREMRERTEREQRAVATRAAQCARRPRPRARRRHARAAAPRYSIHCYPPCPARHDPLRPPPPPPPYAASQQAVAAGRTTVEQNCRRECLCAPTKQRPHNKRPVVCERV